MRGRGGGVPTFAYPLWPVSAVLSEPAARSRWVHLGEQRVGRKPILQTADRMCDRNGGRRLRQWLIEQIDSGMYPGLIWENEEKSMFRIPWKHAGKQDYNQEVDASIFKAWAVFKGKFKEGDKAEPATWKTRLRCALNKSPDFEEVTDRSQLDISEPYKVYRIVPEEEQKCKCPDKLSDLFHSHLPPEY
uniref:IRF tryptophan pentad repeat domain-containing protein n=1 Tax=Gopherus agassizii TaxID=38772 RepID=A0A452GZD1_9SAUR